MKKKSQNRILSEHGYFTYPCSTWQFSLHALWQDAPASHRGTFRTKREAVAFALALPKRFNPNKYGCPNCLAEGFIDTPCNACGHEADSSLP
jgi:hypothetical protein